HTRWPRDWSSDVCSSDLGPLALDRCFLSELVYGPLYRSRSRITWDDVLDLTQTVVAHLGVFVHLTATAETTIERLAARDGTTPKIGRASCRERVELTARA